MSGQPLSTDGYFDSEELMNWLLLNPEIVDFDEAQLPLPPADNQDVGIDIDNGCQVNIKTEEDSTSASAFGGSYSTQQHLSMGSASKRSKVAKVKVDSVPQQSRPAAKVSKKRQRESLEDIEARVNELRSENTDLHAHLMNVTQRTTEVQKQRTAMEKLMITKLAELGDREDADQSELAKVVKQYTDIYADYGKCRQREVAFHLNQLEKLLVPTKTTKLTMWALQQDKKFFQTSESAIFNILSKELELTPEQTEKIQERRERTQLVFSQLKESLSLIEQLKSAIEKKHACYDAICGRVQEAATPKQTVLFLKWISAHADELAKHIPDFSRNVRHTPNVEFVDGVAGALPAMGSGGGSSSSSAGAAGSGSGGGGGGRASRSGSQKK